MAARINPVDWESLLSTWAKPPAETEQSRCDNALSIVRNAVACSPRFNSRSIRVFAQGSYRNRVNVRQDSDVDIGVLCDDTFFYDLPPGVTPQSRLITAPSYVYSQFKNDLHEALANYVGSAGVRRGNKAFKIKETSYHIVADVVPLFEYRAYTSGGYIAGVSLAPDNGCRIDNFPERVVPTWPDLPLHYENGVAKNTATGRRFKSVVRIVKKLRNLMADAGNEVAKPIPGYLIECLVWNANNISFNHNTWLETARTVLGMIWAATSQDDTCKDWREVDNLKLLFHPNQPWSRQQANAFVSSAWQLIGIS
jgi:hypothetical protein